MGVKISEYFPLNPCIIYLNIALTVNVRLNEGDEMVAVRVGDGPLYTVPWNPQEYR